MDEFIYSPQQLAKLPDAEISAHLFGRFITAGLGSASALMHNWQALRDAAPHAARLNGDARGAALHAAAEHVMLSSPGVVRANYNLAVSEAAIIIDSASDRELAQHFFPVLQVRVQDERAFAAHAAGDHSAVPLRQLQGAIIALHHIDGLMVRAPQDVLFAVAEAASRLGYMGDETQAAFDKIRRQRLREQGKDTRANPACE